MALIKLIGSLTFALVLIAVLTAVLIVSTTLESLYGTPFVQRFFYQAGWFDVFLGLVAVNIVCSAASRWPFKKRHTGFVITHAGIFLLLIGSLLSRLYGVDGQMMLVEGETKDTLRENRYELLVHAPDGNAAAYDLNLHSKKPTRRLARVGGDTELSLHRVWDNAVFAQEVAEGTSSDPANRAIKLTLSSETMGAHESVWLIEKNPMDPDSTHMHLGPAVIELKEKEASAVQEAPANPETPAPATPTLRVSKKGSGKTLTLDLLNIPKGETPVPDSPFRVVRVLYHPDARVGNEGLISVSDQPNNPAVEFDVYDTEGKHKHYVKFALYPDFESMHGKDQGETFDIAADFTAPSVSPAKPRNGPSLTIYTGEDGWSYASKSSKSSKEGKLAAGETTAAGWMDFSFHVDQLLTHAVVSKKARRASPDEKGQIAAEVSLKQNGRVLAEDWVTEDDTVTWPLAGGQWALRLRTKERPVPFSLTLKDFRKVDYPGTNRAASFESDVRLHDTAEHVTIEKTISMNKPLDCQGYRIFQSSYVQDPRGGEASIFTVAKNPGIFLIYLGSCVTFLGGFLVFFVPIFSSIKFKERTS